MGTITKALDLLDHFSVTRPEIALSEFHRLTGRDKATLHRHLAELEQAAFVERDRMTRAYRLGPAVLRLAYVRERAFPARSAVAPTVDAMSERLGELVHVSLLQGLALSPLYHADATMHATRVFYDDGELLPLHATSSGLAALAFGPPDLLDRALASPLERFTDHTLTEPGALRALTEQTRARGHAVTDRSFDGDVYSSAVPVFGSAGSEAIGALAVALPAGRATPETRARIIAALLANAGRISAALGGRVPADVERLWSDAA